MLVKVRTGYGYAMGGRNRQPGEVFELPNDEYQKLHQIFERVVKAPVVEAPIVEPKKEEVAEPPVVEPKVEEVIENRAILDSTAGAPLTRSRGRRR